MCPVVVKKESFKTSTQKLRRRSQIMSLLSPDLKFKGCFIIPTTFHLSLISRPNSNDKLSLEIFPFRDLGNLGDGVRIRDSTDRRAGVREIHHSRPGLNECWLRYRFPFL